MSLEEEEEERGGDGEVMEYRKEERGCGGSGRGTNKERGRRWEISEMYPPAQ